MYTIWYGEKFKKSAVYLGNLLGISAIRNLGSYKYKKIICWSAPTTGSKTLNKKKETKVLNHPSEIAKFRNKLYLFKYLNRHNIKTIPFIELKQGVSLLDIQAKFKAFHQIIACNAGGTPALRLKNNLDIKRALANKKIFGTTVELKKPAMRFIIFNKKIICHSFCYNQPEYSLYESLKHELPLYKKYINTLKCYKQGNLLTRGFYTYWTDSSSFKFEPSTYKVINQVIDKVNIDLFALDLNIYNKVANITSSFDLVKMPPKCIKTLSDNLTSWLKK